MRPEDVPNELLLAFINAAMAAGKPVIIQVSAIRAALAAVAPAIKAAALEKAAVVAEGISYHGRYRTWPWWANPDGSQGNRENESDVVRHADKIASAIRALKETT